MAADSPGPIFLDTTVLSNFASSDSVDFLVDLLESPTVVPAVREEIKQGLAIGHEYLRPAAECIGDEFSIRKVSQNVGDNGLHDRLDAGEAATISAAITHGGTVATDDLAARRVAAEKGITKTGSVGLLVRGVEVGHVDRAVADEWLGTWRTERGYYAPVDSIDDVCDEER